MLNNLSLSKSLMSFQLSTVRDGISGNCLALEGFLDDDDEDLGEVIDTDRLHRKKGHANQGTTL